MTFHPSLLPTVRREHGRKVGPRLISGALTTTQDRIEFLREYGLTVCPFVDGGIPQEIESQMRDGWWGRCAVLSEWVVGHVVAGPYQRLKQARREIGI